MKLIGLLTTTALFSFGADALAMPIQPPEVKDTRILNFGVITVSGQVAKDHQTVLSNSTVQINYAAETVTLTYMYAPSCPEGMFCAQVMKQESIELPIVDKTSDDECSVTIIAREDQRPVDAYFVKLKSKTFQRRNATFS